MRIRVGHGGSCDLPSSGADADEDSGGVRFRLRGQSNEQGVWLLVEAVHASFPFRYRKQASGVVVTIAAGAFSHLWAGDARHGMLKNSAIFV